MKTDLRREEEPYVRMVSPGVILARQREEITVAAKVIFSWMYLSIAAIIYARESVVVAVLVTDRTVDLRKVIAEPIERE